MREERKSQTYMHVYRHTDRHSQRDRQWKQSYLVTVDVVSHLVNQCDYLRALKRDREVKKKRGHTETNRQTGRQNKRKTQTPTKTGTALNTQTDTE